jgi:SAM-dependent methyltransferase
MDTAEFFNNHVDYYGVLGPKEYDYFFLRYIEDSFGSKKADILDIGGGGGTFARLCKKTLPNAQITIVDPSTGLLEKQKTEGIKLHIGKLPYELNLEKKFDFIHIKEVLHHVAGNSLLECQQLLSQSILSSSDLLKPGGILMVHEEFYESHIFPILTRSLIFYMLRLQNLIGIRIPSRHILPGLIVCFYTRKELEDTFDECGLFVVNKIEYFWHSASQDRFYKNLLFLKNWGRVCYILAQNPKDPFHH